MRKRSMKVVGVLITGASLVFLIVGLIWAVGTTVGTNISNGGDSGNDNTVNAAGDLVISTTEVGDQGISSTVTTAVTQGYDVGNLPSPSDQTVGFGNTVYYQYSVVNLSNGTDNISISASATAATGTAATGDWTIALYADNGTVGTFESGVDTALVSPVSLGSNAVQNFWVAVTAPSSPTGADGDTVTVQTQVSDSTTDTWDASASVITANPFGPGITLRGDSLTDDTTTTISDVVMFAKLEVSGSANPGDTLTYTISYDNDGSAQANGLVIENAIPANTAYVQNSGSSGNSLHGSGTTVTTQVNIGSFGTPNYQADGTAGTIVAVKWSGFSNPVGAHDTAGDSPVDTVGVADGSPQDADAGQVTYQVTID